jgi:hypothetical protein
VWAALALPSAHAADRPAFPPTRDVSVTYSVTGPDAAGMGPVTLDFSAELQKLRADWNGHVVLIDLPGKSMSLVLAAQHISMRIPVGRDIDRLMTLPEQAALRREGTARVAGYGCTVWHVTAKDGSSGTVCVTDDGVPLRGEGTDPKHRGGGFEATAITYAPQPADLFALPSGVKEMDMSALMARPKP